jgi:pectate lyase
MIFKGSSSQAAAPLATYSSIVFVSTFLSLLIIFILDTATNYDILL